MRKVYVYLIALLILVSVTGCGNEEILSYEDKDDIEVVQNAEEKLARITMIDTYTKDCIKYFVFETNISNDEVFTLSEDEYDKYIGLENDAVDCTIYNLQCSSNVFSYKYHVVGDVDLCNMESLIYILSKLKDIETYSNPLDFIVQGDRIQIHCAYDTYFDRGEYSLRYHNNNKDQMDITSTMSFSRYSFAGENDFTEEEIGQYTEIMNSVNCELVNYCNDAIQN